MRWVVLEQRLQNSSATATLQLPLTAEERTVLRGRRTTSCGRPVLLQLPRVGSLQPGDLLGDQSGSTVVGGDGSSGSIDAGAGFASS